MKFHRIGAAAASALAVLALATSLAFAMPKNVAGPSDMLLKATDLAGRIGHWDATDVADFAKADTIYVFRISDAYDFDDHSMVSGAEDEAGTLGDMHKAFAANADVAKWFKDNGYVLNDMMAIVHMPDKNAFAVYLH